MEMLQKMAPMVVATRQCTPVVEKMDPVVVATVNGPPGSG